MNENKTKEQVMLEMDAAAEIAQTELQSMIKDLGEDLTARRLAAWWKRHYQKAGHKRLGRALLYVFKDA